MQVIDYSDGDAIEREILEIVRRARDTSSSSWVAGSSYPSWPVRYHLSPERANLLRHLDFEGLSVIELGAGMGAVSRFLAERSKNLYVVEGTRPRFAVLSERLRDLNNWEGQVANIGDVQAHSQFDVVCLIGVLEYSELFVQPPSGESPFLWVIKKAKEFLKPDGVMILAIENKIGIKYWSGAAEDHTGQLFDGIADYPVRKSPRTFSARELRRLLSTGGFGSVVEHSPFPDYKVATTVLSSPVLDGFEYLPADLACQRRFDNHGLPRIRYFPELLACYTLSKAGSLRDFSNSFLWIAGSTGNSPTMAHILKRTIQNHEVAWHYSLDRKFPVSTRFFLRNEVLASEKIPLTRSDREPIRLTTGDFSITWTVPDVCRVHDRPSVRSRLLSQAYFGHWDDFTQSLLHFLQWSFERWRCDSNPASLNEEAFDALFVNAVYGELGDYLLFDLEWSADQPVTLRRFVFRNVLMLERDLESLSRAPFSSLEHLYEILCEKLDIAADFEADLEAEVVFYQTVTPRASYDSHQKLLTLRMRSTLSAAQLPRSPVEESAKLQQLEDLERFAAQLNSLPHKVTTKLVRAVQRRRWLVGALSTVGPRVYEWAKRVRKITRFPARLARRWELRVRPRDLQTKESVYDVIPLGGDFPSGLCQLVMEGDFQGSSPVLEIKFLPQSSPQLVTMHVDLPSAENTVKQLLRIRLEMAAVVLSFRGAERTVGVRKFHLRRLGMVGTARTLLSERVISIAGLIAAGLRVIRSGPKAARQILSTKVRQLPYLAVDPYTAWIERFDTLTESDKASIKLQGAGLPIKPIISVLLPVYNTDERWLVKAIESVRAQLYPHWELCIADDASTLSHIKPILNHYASMDQRIRVVFRESNGHIAEASNSALRLATGEFIALLDHDDELAPHALYCVAAEVSRFPTADLLYSDEDLMDTHGRRFAPHFKPDWCEDLFYSINQITHLAVFRHSLVKEVGGFRKGFEGSQDWDLMLRVIESSAPEKVRHIPWILYHWRAIPGSVASGPGAKNYAHLAARRAIGAHLSSRGLTVEVVEGNCGLHQVVYPLPDPRPKVSVIICTKDRVDLLKEAVSGLLRKTEYAPIEIIIVDNESSCRETLEYLSRVERDKMARIVRSAGPFNFSQLNNRAAQVAVGELLLFMNNDIRVSSANWLSEMVRLAVLPEIGVVGAKLLFPDNRVQHSGIVLGLGEHGVAGHAQALIAGTSSGYWGRNVVTQNFSAVTGACMMVRRQVFLECGGFDEQDLPVAYNDVDLCLRIGKSGLRVVWTPFAQLYHLESASRGSDRAGKNRERLHKESQIMKARWRHVLNEDPCYNPNLSLDGTGFDLAYPPRVVKPWTTPSLPGESI